MSESYLHLSSNKEPVHFYHANGFPAGVYMPFLNQLNLSFDVYALNSRATHPDAGEPDHSDWHVFADDLIKFLEKQGKPIIAIGHSMGASATVLAATKRPDLFKALILIEPAMLDWPLSLVFKFTPKRYIKNSKLVQGTLNKKDSWNSREDFSSYIKRFKGYKKFSPEAYDAFTQHAVAKLEAATGDQAISEADTFKLAFHKEWEAHNYTMPPYLMGHFAKLEQLKIPTVAIRGNVNGFFPDKYWTKWKNNQPSAVFLQDKNFAHLIPLEGPKECMALVNKGLKQLGLK